MHPFIPPLTANMSAELVLESESNNIEYFTGNILKILDSKVSNNIEYFTSNILKILDSKSR